MSKSKAVQWPVLVASSLPRTPACHPSAPSTALISVSRPHSNINRKSHSAWNSAPGISFEPSAESPSTSFVSTTHWRSEFIGTKTCFARHNSSRNVTTSVSCLSSCGYFSPLLPTIATSRTLPSSSSRLGRLSHCQKRQSHSFTTPDAQYLSSQTVADIGTNVPRQRRTRAPPLTATAMAKTRPTNISESLSKIEVEIPGSRRHPLGKHQTSTSVWARSSTATHPDEASAALANFKLLIHSDHPRARHLRSETASYRGKMIAEHRIPCTIIPPLSALQQLYSYLESSDHINQLTPIDWDLFVFWLSHHKDYRTLGFLHTAALSDPQLGSRYSSASFSLLTEARVKAVISDQSSWSISGQRGPQTAPSNPQSPSLVVKSTIDCMESIEVPRSSNLYGLWLRMAVLDKNWNDGIEAWKRLKAERRQLPSPSIAMAGYTIQCYLHTCNLSEVAKLIESILEQSAASQQRQNFVIVMDGGLLPGTSGGNGEGEWEAGATDGRLEFMKRQKQTLQELAALQQRATTTTGSEGDQSLSLSSQQIQEWVAVLNPVLIEAICLDDQDQHGASLASELAIELFSQGCVLDKTRFRLLTRYIGACHTVERAEVLMRTLIDLTKSSLPTLATHLPAKEGYDSASALSPLKDLRRMKVATDSTSRILVEVGLQEIIKQASIDGDLDRARDVFRGMVDQGISLSLEASERLITALTKTHDFRSAMAVLDRSLQDKKAPSIETANALLRGLIRGDLLEDSVAVFRDLTESHGLKPNVEMYRNLMNLTSAYGQLAMTQRILSTLKGLGVKRDGELYRDLMRCYVRSENLQGAIKVFENMDRAGIVNETKHINVLLEGAVRHSSPPTIVGVLEIMSSQRIRPDPETWNILLSGAFRARDRVLAQELYQELSHSVVEGVTDRADGSLRASRHPETFQLLMGEYAARHGVEPALKLLKGALEAGYPSRVAPSMYRELIDMSCKQGKGTAGYEFYQLLRRSTLTHNTSVASTSTTATTSTSPSTTSPPLSALYRKLMALLDQEGQIGLGKEMATDLILSGAEMDQEVVTSAIRFYARSGELAAAFGLFTKMGRAYGVEPSQEMVQVLFEASRTHGLIPGSSSSVLSSIRSTTISEALRTAEVPRAAGAPGSTTWDEGVAQSWMKALKAAMERLGVA